MKPIPTIEPRPHGRQPAVGRDLPKRRTWLYSPIMRNHSSLRTCSFVVKISLALWLTTAVWAEEASVTGTLTANGETVGLPHVYVYAEEKGFYDDKDPTWKVVFAAQPIEERKLDSFFVDFPYVKIRAHPHFRVRREGPNQGLLPGRQAAG